MEELPERPEDHKRLHSADFASAGMIILIFFFSMCFLVNLVSLKTPSAQAQKNNLFASKAKKTDGAKVLALANPLPPSSKLLAPPKIEKKPTEPVYKFPVFRGKRGEKDYHPIIHETAKRHAVDPALIKAIVMAESSYNPSAVSNKGAVGLMQLMPATAESLGVVNRFNPEQNVRGGVKYFKQLMERLDGDIEMAIAAYNAGLGPVLKYGGIPPFKDTRYYVQKVFHYYEHYKKQDEAQAGLDEKKGEKAKPLQKMDEA